MQRKTRSVTRRTFLGSAAGGMITALRPPLSSAWTNGLADDIAAAFTGHCVGFSFTISNASGTVAARSWGEARRAQDPPARAMSHLEKFNIASASKTITAAALLRLLVRPLSYNSTFAPFLPSHWTVHDSIKNLTFKQLMRHESGFRFASDDVDYTSLKADMQAGVDTSLIGQYKYHNVNYGIMRLLIPRLAGYGIYNILPGTSPWTLPALETYQAAEFAAAYIDYVQKNVWDKTAVAPNMACKPTSQYPALCYQFPYTNDTGGDFDDMTLTCGSRGWNASSFQLNAFMRTLHFSGSILTESLSNMMIYDRMGYDNAELLNNGVWFYHKGGFYPGSMNPGELHSYLIGFDTGVQIGLIVNSQFIADQDMLTIVRQCFEAWHGSRRPLAAGLTL